MPLKSTMLPISTARRWRRRVERRHRSQWAGHREHATPRLLPFRFGDGRQLVNLSFYAAPEIEICVMFDSRLPLDLPDNERFMDSAEIRSFRDVVDSIYDLCQEHIPIPRYRARELEKEIVDYYDSDELEPWDLIIEDGSTWSDFRLSK